MYEDYRKKKIDRKILFSFLSYKYKKKINKLGII